MGCATSKQKDKKLCRNCQAPYIPVRRSYSLHSHDKKEGEEESSFNLVAIKSLGSFKLDLFDHKHKPFIIQEDDDQDEDQDDEESSIQKKEEFVMGMVEAKTWSKMIDQKIPKFVPKTPTTTPPGEPETINAWELMEGLEEDIIISPLNHTHSFSFNLASTPVSSSNQSSISHPVFRKKEHGHSFGDYLIPKVHENGEESNQGSISHPVLQEKEHYPTSKVHENGEKSIKPLWVENDDKESNQSSISHPILQEKEHYPTSKVHENNGEESMKPLWLENGDDDESNSISNETSIASEFDPEVIASFRKALEELPPTNPFHMKPIKQDGKVDDEGLLCNKKDKLIVYFTSLRGVRKTYEDCCDVRAILKGLGVKIDERDVSMHSGFKDELKELLLLSGEEGLMFTLPKVFIEKKYIGGAEEIRRMHEEGRLEKAVESCESVDGSGGGIGRVCESCGDVRFVPCDTCFGSCKIYYEDDDNEEEEESEESTNCGFQPCPDCNENGLIRCPLCCD